MGAFFGRTPCVAALVAAVAACSTSTPVGLGNGGGSNNGTTQTEYDMALKKWQTVGPEHYRVVVAQTCECSFDMQRPTRLTVRRIPGPNVESIEEVVDAATLQPVGQDRRLAAKSVDGLLVLISQALALNPQDARITYNATFGYPVSINVDPVTSFQGDEVVYKVTSFEALP